MGSAIAKPSLVVLVLLTGCGGSGSPKDVASPSPEPGLAEAKRFTEYQVFHLGRSYGSLPLTSAERSRDGLKRSLAMFSFVYGDCEPDPNSIDSGCVPPYEVQDYAACSRNPTIYDAPYRKAKIRGVPAAIFSDSVELYTGKTSVTVFAPSPEAARHAAARLVSADGKIGRGQDLPPPAKGAFEGHLRC